MEGFREMPSTIDTVKQNPHGPLTRAIIEESVSPIIVVTIIVNAIVNNNNKKWNDT